MLRRSTPYTTATEWGAGDGSVALPQAPAPNPAGPPEQDPTAGGASLERDPAQAVNRVVSETGRVILGKATQIRLALACLLARGHLLIEDLPGVGKTTLAHALAQALGLHFQRIQFTSDLLPADILGISIYDRDSGRLQFHPGPIFAQVILADEVNRATPKTQSALLEAMAEQQVTIEGETRPLPAPFFVIATQNPFHQVGTFPLPESQLDRFLMRIAMGYPDPAAERALLRGEDRRTAIEQVQARLTAEDLVVVQQRVRQVHVSDAVLDYIQALIGYSRQSPAFPAGLSPRAGLALVQAARAWAFLAGRDMVLPEDVQAVLPGVVTHRLWTATDLGAQAGESPAQILLRAVPVS